MKKTTAKFTRTGLAWILAAAAAAAAVCMFVLFRPSAPASLAQAMKAVDVGNDTVAMRMFDAILHSKDTRAEEAAAALYGKGFIYEHRRPAEDFDAARNAYSEVAEKYPETPVASLALLAMGRCYEIERGQGNLPQARETYLAVTRRFPGSEAAVEAELRLGLTYFSRMEEQEIRAGMQRLDAWLAGNPEHPYRGAVLLMTGRAYLDVLDDPVKSLETLLRADEAGIQTTSIRGDLYYQIAWLAHVKAGRPEIARKYYEKIIEEFDTDPRAYLAKGELRKMGNPEP